VTEIDLEFFALIFFSLSKPAEWVDVQIIFSDVRSDATATQSYQNIEITYREGTCQKVDSATQISISYISNENCFPLR